MQKYKVCEHDEEEEGMLMGRSPLSERIWLHQLETFREIHVNKDIDDTMVEMVVIQIMNINRYDDAGEKAMKDFERVPIKIFFNTNGGDIYSCLAVCSAIEMSKTPVHCIALGKAMSAGFLMLVCGAKRYAQQYSILMHHTGSTWTGGTFTDIIEEAEVLARLNAKIHDILLRHTNIPEERLDEVFKCKQNWYVEIDEALELGIIDGIYGLAEQAEDELDEECIECIQRGEDDCDNCPKGVEEATE